MNSSIIIKPAENTVELEQILQLQSQNHIQNLTPENQKVNGFVTVKHDLELLTKMSHSAPQIIAKDKEEVVGYALVMLKEFREMIPVLIPMFDMFNHLSFGQRKVSDYRFYVMGQICVAEAYRGQGLVEALYVKHKELYSNTFDICLTEVSVNNRRSMKAHEKIGFQTIHTFKDQTDEWNILLWDWSLPLQKNY